MKKASLIDNVFSSCRRHQSEQTDNARVGKKGSIHEKWCFKFDNPDKRRNVASISSPKEDPSRIRPRKSKQVWKFTFHPKTFLLWFEVVWDFAILQVSAFWPPWPAVFTSSVLAEEELGKFSWKKKKKKEDEWCWRRFSAAQRRTNEENEVRTRSKKIFFRDGDKRRMDGRSAADRLGKRASDARKIQAVKSRGPSVGGLWNSSDGMWLIDPIPNGRQI